jgi:hypothetical protein
MSQGAYGFICDVVCPGVFFCVARRLSVGADLVANGGARVVKVAGFERSIGVHEINLLLVVDVFVVLFEAFEGCSMVVVAAVDAVWDAVN